MNVLSLLGMVGGLLYLASLVIVVVSAIYRRIQKACVLSIMLDDNGEYFLVCGQDTVSKLTPRRLCYPPVLVDENEEVIAQFQGYSAHDAFIPFN